MPGLGSTGADVRGDGARGAVARRDAHLPGAVVPQAVRVHRVVDSVGYGRAVVSQHAYRRVTERLTPAEQQQFFNRMTVLTQYARNHAQGHDWAVRILKLEGQRNDAWSDESNGDEVWAVLRRGELKTVMLRRSSQPPTAQALRVDKVVFL